MTADELADLADRLREGGKVRTAYICQRRAVEMEPDDSDLMCNLGELAHIVGRRDEAREAYERCLKLNPADAEIRHLLTSLRDENPPSRVPNACIRQLYSRFSSFYESNMRGELGYEGPEHLEAAIRDVIGERTDLRVLDLGCGTGLAGRQMKTRASRLVGVDLSAEMIEIARGLNIYDQLDVAEVTDWLDGARERFDLIAACDTFIYFGDLRQVIQPALSLLKQNGVIAFSVEKSHDEPYRLTDSGRYEHHLDHIQTVAREYGLICAYRQAFLRMEYGREVTAYYVTLAAA